MQHPARTQFVRPVAYSAAVDASFGRRSYVAGGGRSSGDGGAEPSPQPLPRLPHSDRRTLPGFVAAALRIHSGDGIHSCKGFVRTGQNRLRGNSVT
ncbi:hypothetical protein TPAR_05499 [Tolypocladium paradoxum]|uniref:Uncharacterized protein n=1 Tax=Tolypocladium paradoxum TaxID=94208 RepID=A0A2S4KVT3_9HYPO|nr:hypothetical protein TPAR_05499 [Tolypocladium paradoxum]